MREYDADHTERGECRQGRPGEQASARVALQAGADEGDKQLDGDEKRRHEYPHPDRIADAGCVHADGEWAGHAARLGKCAY
jgi:hypothetical protein